jgi:O-antigen/teichoic acid export membrane protein
VTAAGRGLAGVVIYRGVLPVTLLALLSVLPFLGVRLTTLTAATVYGVAWSVATALIWALMLRAIPPNVRRADPVFESREWVRNAAPLFLYSLLMTALAQSTVIVLGFVATSDSVVGSYAVSAQIGSFVVLLATSTNRFYSPRLSILMEQGDRATMLRMRRHRVLLIGTITAVYTLGIVAFGREILGTFGPEYRGAYAALVCITAGAAVSTSFSMAPVYLQFAGRNRFVLSATGVAVAVNVGLCLVLGPRLGALGGGISYAVSLAGLFVAFRVVGLRHAGLHLDSGSRGGP